MNKSKTLQKIIDHDSVLLRKHFPKDRIYTIHQNGSTLDKSGKGVMVVIKVPLGSKVGRWEVISDDEEGYGVGKLCFDKKLITDYDGAFELPHLVEKVLKEDGYEFEWEKLEKKK